MHSITDTHKDDIIMLRNDHVACSVIKEECLANAKVSARQPCCLKKHFEMKWLLKVIVNHSFL